MSVRGSCTLILSRVGPRDTAGDERLLRDTEVELGLPSGSLRPAATARPEFRLVEGVSRETAERLATRSLRHGFEPRIRDRIGIKWSNERGLGGLAAMTLAGLGVLLVATAALVVGSAALGVPLAAMPLLPVLFGAFAFMMIGVHMAWMNSIYLPVVVPAAVVPEETGSEIREARLALAALRDAIADAPAQARIDLDTSYVELSERVDTLAEDDRRLGPDDARRAEVTAALGRIRDAARSAVTMLHDDEAPDPVERLEAQAARLNLANREAARRAAQRRT